MKQRASVANRLDNFDDIGDVGDFEEMTKLMQASAAERGGGYGNERDLDFAGDEDEEDMDDSRGSRNKKKMAAVTSLQRALGSMTGSSGKNNKPNAASMMDDDYDEGGAPNAYESMLGLNHTDNDTGGRKRRRAPAGPMFGDDEDGVAEDYGDDDGDDGNEDLLESFSRKKKAFLQKKKEHYTPAPRFGGYEENVQEGSKRAASYEIIKNKGLTPHRKKANRNPRVKKRLMYDKALVRRKGQVREVVSGAAGNYAGEMTGIKANVARSRKLAV